MGLLLDPSICFSIHRCVFLIRVTGRCWSLILEAGILFKDPIQHTHTHTHTFQKSGSPIMLMSRLMCEREVKYLEKLKPRTFMTSPSCSS